MLHKPLKLTEYVPAKAVDLTPDEAGSLRRLLPSMSVSPSWEAPGTYDIVPGRSGEECCRATGSRRTR